MFLLLVSLIDFVTQIPLSEYLRRLPLVKTLLASWLPTLCQERAEPLTSPPTSWQLRSSPAPCTGSSVEAVMVRLGLCRLCWMPKYTTKSIFNKCMRVPKKFKRSGNEVVASSFLLNEHCPSQLQGIWMLFAFEFERFFCSQPKVLSISGSCNSPIPFYAQSQFLVALRIV